MSLRLIMGGSAPVTFSGRTFYSADPANGVHLGGVSELVEGAEAASPRPEVALLSPERRDQRPRHGSLRRRLSRHHLVWRHRPHDRPAGRDARRVLFAGYVDFAPLTAGEGQAQTVVECVTAAEYFHDRGEGYALNNASHQIIQARRARFRVRQRAIQAGLLGRRLARLDGRRGDAGGSSGGLGRSRSRRPWRGGPARDADAHSRPRRDGR
jgi:hypothetical protein